MRGTTPAVLEQAATLSDLTRCRILRLLERQALMVSELIAVLQIPQSTVSRHLRVLCEGGWLHVRPEGNRHYYELEAEAIPEAARRLWALVRDQLVESRGHEEDLRRLEAVLRSRQSRSREFFSRAAADWDRLRDELYGSRFDVLALGALLEASHVVGDLACGTGRVASALAPFVRRVVAIDSSEAMLAAARERLLGLANVEVREGSLERLPLKERSLDLALLFVALHHVAEPGRVFAEAARVLKPEGRLLVVDMMPHDREDYQRQMGHVWLGFSRSQMERHYRAGGFGQWRYIPLPAAPEARGPTLFAAVGRSWRGRGGGEAGQLS